MRKDFVFKYRKVIIILLLICGIFTPIFLFFLKNRNSGITGPIGDTFGGIAGPITNLIGAVLVYLSFFEQNKANMQHESEIERLEKEKENEKKNTIRIRNFEICLSDINQIEIMANNISYTDASKKVNGTYALDLLVKSYGINKNKTYNNISDYIKGYNNYFHGASTFIEFRNVIKRMIFLIENIEKLEYIEIEKNYLLGRILLFYNNSLVPGKEEIIDGMKDTIGNLMSKRKNRKDIEDSIKQLNDTAYLKELLYDIMKIDTYLRRLKSENSH